MFRFSEGVKDATELLSWLTHFDGRAIPAGVVKSDGMYSLWREGRDAFLQADERPEKPDSKSELFLAVSGFDVLWEAERFLDKIMP